MSVNEKPFALSFFPSGTGDLAAPLIILDDEVVQMNAFKQAEQSEDYIIRLFEPTGQARSTSIHMPLFNLKQEVDLKPFEIKTLRLDIASKTLSETGLME